MDKKNPWLLQLIEIWFFIESMQFMNSSLDSKNLLKI